jgi:hypothetical protein
MAGGAVEEDVLLSLIRGVLVTQGSLLQRSCPACDVLIKLVATAMDPAGARRPWQEAGSGMIYFSFQVQEQKFSSTTVCRLAAELSTRQEGGPWSFIDHWMTIIPRRLWAP